MRRRDLVAMLESSGFWSIGGKKHEKFTNGDVMVLVKSHREIEDEIAKRIIKQAGLN